MMNMARIRRFFSDYGIGLLGILILVAELILDLLGVHIENGFSFSFGIFVVLLVIQAIKPQAELNKLLNSRPHIVVKKAYPRRNVPTTDFVFYDHAGMADVVDRYAGGTGIAMDYKPAVRQIYGDTDSSDVEITEQTYVLVEFQNNPERRAKVHDAVEVIARIRYHNDKGDDILGKEIKGLWAGREPSRLTVPKEDYEFTQMTIPANGDERILCIGIKQKDDEDCFAYSLESYRGGKFLKNDDLKLGAGVIRVDITLSGSNLDDVPFSFRLVNPGKGRDITVTRILLES
ncbi:MAG: hypothetical protein MUO30_06045 [Anaerolineales bacterium]|nr:hypothetical protein [Anaerolineales bacterium]